MTPFPPLNTPIQHTGGATCPVALETSIIATSDLWEGQPKPFSIAGLAPWEFIDTYTIIARAPADRIKELEAALEYILDGYGFNAPDYRAQDGEDDWITDRARAALKGVTE